MSAEKAVLEPPEAPEPPGADGPSAIQEAGETPHGYGAVLRNRQFLLVWAAQVLSQTAQNVVNYALVVEVEQLTHSSTNVGWVIVSFSLPALLLGPAAGVFVDRVSKRRVLLGTNLLRALLMVAFLLLPTSLFAFYGVTFAASAISQFFAPAEGAIIPLIVRRRDLITATSLFNLTFTAAQVAGFVLLGPTLYKLFGATSLFLTVVMMYLLAAVCVALLRAREAVRSTLAQAVRRAADFRAVWGDMTEVRAFLKGTPALVVAFGYLALATALLMTLATLGPGFVARVLGLGAEDAGYVLAPAGLGMLLSTALLGQFAAGVNRNRLAGAGLVLMALSIALLALVRPVFDKVLSELAAHGPGALPFAETAGYLAVVCVITLSLGVEFSFVTIPAQTAVSEATEESLRGRVFALLFMLTGTVSAIPVLVIGILADNLGIVRMLLALAALVAVAGVAGWRAGGSPRRAE